MGGKTARAVLGLAGIVYLDQASFVAALQNAVGPAAGQYTTQIQTAARVNGETRLPNGEVRTNWSAGTGRMEGVWRTMSAFACSIEIPGFRRARPRPSPCGKPASERIRILSVDPRTFFATWAGDDAATLRRVELVYSLGAEDLALGGYGLAPGEAEAICGSDGTAEVAAETGWPKRQVYARGDLREALHWQRPIVAAVE